MTDVARLSFKSAEDPNFNSSIREGSNHLFGHCQRPEKGQRRRLAILLTLMAGDVEPVCPSTTWNQPPATTAQVGIVVQSRQHIGCPKSVNK